MVTARFMFENGYCLNLGISHRKALFLSNFVFTVIVTDFLSSENCRVKYGSSCPSLKSEIHNCFVKGLAVTIISEHSGGK